MTPHRQAARVRGQRLSVDRAGLGSTGERGRAPSDIPAASRENAGHAGQEKRRLGLPEERPACILRIDGRTPVVAQVEHRYDHGWLRVRLWMGQRWPRGVRWSHTPRTANEADVVRAATPRELAIGHPA